MRLALASLLAVAAAGGIPVPTPAQLKWQQGEIMALIHFNMATFVKVRRQPAAAAWAPLCADLSAQNLALTVFRPMTPLWRRNRTETLGARRTTGTAA